MKTQSDTIMKEIKENLIENEKILWQYSHKNNLLIKPLRNLIGSGILIIIGIFYSIYSFLRPIFSFIPALFGIILIFAGSLFAITILMRILALKISTELTLKGLFQYQAIFVITDRRWIQKSFELNMKVDGSIEELQIINNLVGVTLDNIKAIITDSSGIIEFRLDFIDDVHSDNFNETWIGVEIKSPEKYKSFMDVISKLILFEEINHQDEFHYYCRKD